MRRRLVVSVGVTFFWLISTGSVFLVVEVLP